MDERSYSEIRKDPVMGRWVIINKDPGYIPDLNEKIVRPEKKDNCPFCAGNETMTPEEIISISLNDHDPWSIRIVPNKYPALNGNQNLSKEGIGIFDKMTGYGFHEVVIESPQHKNSLSDLSKEHVFNIFRIIKKRILELKDQKDIKYILVFKNEGSSAGASIEHSHLQLIGTPIVPKRVQEELDGSKFYYDYKKRCIFCDILKEEHGSKGERIIYENENMISISPYAARFPFETWILPKSHASHFENSSDEILMDLSEVLLFYLKALDKNLINPHYNMILHNSPVKEGTEKHYHWHIEIIPKIKKIAGFEWGTGFYINPISPEDCTNVLKRRSE
ncbi:galactose-1-phosphate uridylyltransferase [bacterium]|nr:galactose-1-phosphate uridylyltransferase [bacterium]